MVALIVSPVPGDIQYMNEEEFTELIDQYNNFEDSDDDSSDQEVEEEEVVAKASPESTHEEEDTSDWYAPYLTIGDGHIEKMVIPRQRATSITPPGSPQYQNQQWKKAAGVVFQRLDLDDEVAAALGSSPNSSNDMSSVERTPCPLHSQSTPAPRSTSSPRWYWQGKL
eukprot:GFYU01037196.1.p1 GENE.GFYU01037196.1~~GFYU01037196.1.p1  ORF type:complete len:168 (-),score=28.42 GFYU01037196.1:9-512(-)